MSSREVTCTQEAFLRIAGLRATLILGLTSIRANLRSPWPAPSRTRCPARPAGTSRNRAWELRASMECA